MVRASGQSVAPTRVLVVNDGGGNANPTQAFTTALTNLGIDYDVVNSSTGSGIPATMTDYSAVLYAGNPNTGPEADQLMAYLDAGGRLLVADNDFGYYDKSMAIYMQYFQATYLLDNGSDGAIEGADIMAGIDLDISSDPYPDSFSLGPDAVGIFANTAPRTDWAGSRIERNGYRAIYLAWDFHYAGGSPVGDQVETDIVEAALGWLVGFAPDINVSPLSLNALQPPDTTTQQTLTIGNTGTGSLVWDVLEAQEAQKAFQTLPGIKAAPEPVFDVPEAVTSVEDCAAFQNFPGREPPGWAQFCAPLNAVAASSPETPVVPLGPTSLGSAQDIGYISDHFVRFFLNDFPGQTVVVDNIYVYYGIDFDATATTLYALNDSADELGIINADGSFTGIVACPPPDGAGNWTGLSIDPLTNEFYASTAVNLYRLDPATGSPTLVGPFGTSLMIAIAIGPQGVMYGHDIGTDSIYTIDTTTGAATLVGPTGYAANYAQGMDFDNEDGTLYIWLYTGSGANTYGTVDLATGAVTPLATDNPLGEFEGATQTVAFTACSNPSDVPWLSVTPDNGTTAPGDNATLDVTFDSTGLAVGTYSANLCVNSNDPDDAPGNGTKLVVVPVTLEVVECLDAGDCDDDGLFCTGVPVCDNNTCGSSGDPCVGDPDLPHCYEAGGSCVECLVDGDCNATEWCRENVCMPRCELTVTHKRILSQKLTKPRKVVLNVTSADEIFDIFGLIDPGVFTWDKVKFNRKKNRLKIFATVPAGLAPGAYPISVGDCFGEVVVE